VAPRSKRAAKKSRVVAEDRAAAGGDSRDPPQPTVRVLTDASNRAWGATTTSTPSLSAQGKWSPVEMRLHINALELLAVQKAIELWGNLWEGSHVLFLMDNRTAVSYISKQGGTRSSCLNAIAESIFRLATVCRLTLSASYLPGEMNVVADLLSRAGEVLKNEWCLGPQAFQWLCSRNPFAPPTVDLFANSHNHRLPRYFSPCPDPAAAGY
jgi:hypothetical protein